MLRVCKRTRIEGGEEGWVVDGTANEHQREKRKVAQDPPFQVDRGRRIRGRERIASTKKRTIFVRCRYQQSDIDRSCVCTSNSREGEREKEEPAWVAAVLFWRSNGWLDMGDNEARD